MNTCNTCRGRNWIVEGGTPKPCEGCADCAAEVGRLEAEVRAMRTLKAGWDSYESRPIDPDAIRWALRMIEPLIELGLGEVSAVPCPGGGVQLEIHDRGIDLELWIEAALARDASDEQ